MDRDPTEVAAGLPREASNRGPVVLPRVIGHRGAAGAAPENTLAAIRKAKELGVAWIEFDVKLTGDGHPILFHDDRLERTTDGYGLVAAATLAQIQRLDAGAWFSPAFRGERVPMFEDVLALCIELGLGINVEIKPCRRREAETAKAAVGALLRQWPKSLPAPVVSSFAPECLRVARELAPALPRGYLAGRLPRHWQAMMARYGCTTLHLDQRWLGIRQRSAVVAAGVPLVLYTVNDGERARRHLETGVTAVITDHIGRILGSVGPTSTQASDRGAAPSSGASSRPGDLEP
jgi:glycerophosphoryl diester phosphodiesterase